MRKTIFDRLQFPDTRTSLLFLTVGAFFSLLTSPKWLFPPAAWAAPLALLLFYRQSTMRRHWLLFLFVNAATSAVTLYGVMPFPVYVLLLLSVLEGGKALLLFALDRFLTRGQRGFAFTFVFPALNVAREYLESLDGMGAWVTVANTQYAFPWLTQLASVSGVWGISFLIYWLASVLVWALNNRAAGRKVGRGLAGYALVLGTVLLFGAFRYYRMVDRPHSQLTIGGVTVPSLPFFQALYRDKTGQLMTLDPKASQSSPQFQRVYSAFAPFIENPDPKRFTHGMAALRQLHDDLFRLSHTMVRRGAKLVMWSEGNGLVLKADEPALLERGRTFAATHQVYLLMTVGVILPGKVTPDRMFLENKTVLFDPQGRLLNTFYKNHPVPMAEQSAPGDGRIPALDTPFGRIAPSICYDADFIQTMRQLGRQRIGLLLLPSGDWYSISPYHSHMAVFRGIENGTSVARQVSGGLSLFTDYRGKVWSQLDFFSPGEKTILAKLPVLHVPTLYTRFGDWLPLGCLLSLLIFGGIRLKKAMNRSTWSHKEMALR